ncbi:dolichol-phosphate mannosyltransferase subunit 3 [Coniella lustricola]|uniref:Dolichol-phosphate mannosyltransferase subunit 3 n=1 Tax=Coniella lustricola TaxID=2025994 RepID=A0A2T2ZYE2_9PEZI|nr:dolichol-phosphate mannosyltransferase subunit 3 [Coniella lustricola]
MTRAQQTVSIALLVSSLYLSLYLQLIPLPTIVQTEIVPVLPFWALVSFGAYLLVRLGWGVLTFNDCPEAHKELMGEIEVAKTELRKMGVTVD